jgi:hypothetical protein
MDPGVMDAQQPSAHPKDKPPILAHTFSPTKCLLYLTQVTNKGGSEPGKAASAGPYLPHSDSLFEGE